MNLREVKEWIENLPDEYKDYQVVFCEWSSLENDYVVRLDKPICILEIDTEHQEAIVASRKD